MELISRKGYEKLCEELKDVDREIEQTHRDLKESVERDNDLRENSEYKELKEKVMYIFPRKKRDLYERIKNCQIIEETDEYKGFDGNVIAGSEVKLVYDGEEETYVILGDKECDYNNNIISHRAPLIQAILGKRSNDTVKFNESVICIKQVTRLE